MVHGCWPAAQHSWNCAPVRVELKAPEGGKQEEIKVVADRGGRGGASSGMYELPTSVPVSVGPLGVRL